MTAYADLDPLRVRIATHRDHTVGVDRLENDVLEALRLAGSESVLDVGAGTGEFLARLRAQGHRGRLVGVDASAAAFAEGRTNLPDAEWQQVDASSLPFGDRCFERVAARHMLYHVDEPRDVLEEARRVLRRGGVFVATVNIAGPYRKLNALVADALAANRLEPGPSPAPLDADTLQPLLEESFPEVGALVRRSELVFEHAAPVAAYATSLLELHDLPDEPGLHRRLSRWIAAEAENRLVAMGGTWRDDKGYAVFACAVEDY